MASAYDDAAEMKNLRKYTLESVMEHAYSDADFLRNVCAAYIAQMSDEDVKVWNEVE